MISCRCFPINFWRSFSRISFSIISRNPFTSSTRFCSMIFCTYQVLPPDRPEDDPGKLLLQEFRQEFFCKFFFRISSRIFCTPFRSSSRNFFRTSPGVPQLSWSSSGHSIHSFFFQICCIVLLKLTLWNKTDSRWTCIRERPFFQCSKATLKSLVILIAWLMVGYSL